MSKHGDDIALGDTVLIWARLLYPDAVQVIVDDGDGDGGTIRDVAAADVAHVAVLGQLEARDAERARVAVAGDSEAWFVNPARLIGLTDRREAGP